MTGHDLVCSPHWCASPWISRSAASITTRAALPSDATRLDAYEPVCGPAHRHRAVLLRRLGRELGLESY